MKSNMAKDNKKPLDMGMTVGGMTPPEKPRRKRMMKRAFKALMKKTAPRNGDSSLT